MSAVKVWLCNPDAVGRLAVANVLRCTAGIRVIGATGKPPKGEGRDYDILVVQNPARRADVKVIVGGRDQSPTTSRLRQAEGQSASAYRAWATEVLVPALIDVPTDPAPRHSVPPRQERARNESGASYVPHVGVSLVAIAASTGGPDALEAVLSGLAPNFPLPVVVVQHMGEAFTEGFAARLDRRVDLPVRHAEDGMRLLPGTVVVARGGRHLVVRRDEKGYLAQLSDGPLEHGCRPAADVMFRSLSCTEGKLLAVVLTGLGEDGGAGAAALRQLGARVLVQDEETSVIWGMPGSVVARGAADEVLPLQDIAQRITHHASRTVVSCS